MGHSTGGKGEVSSRDFTLLSALDEITGQPRSTLRSYSFRLLLTSVALFLNVEEFHQWLDTFERSSKHAKQ